MIATTAPETVRRIALYGTLHGFLAATFLPGAGFGSGFEAVAIAHTLARSGSFADPYYALRTGPTAHMAPLFPAYLGVIMRCIGESVPMLFFVATLSSAMALGGLLAMLPALAQQILGDRAAGVTVAWTAILIPVFQMSTQWDVVFFSTGLAGFCLFSLRVANTDRWPAGLMIGIVGGLVSLINPAGIPFMAVWLAGLCAMRRYQPRTLVLAAVAGIVVCLPWMIRNLRELNTFCVRDNLGLELQVSNNDIAEASFLSNLASVRRFHPNLNHKEASAVRTFGEARYNSRKMNDALHWIASHPFRFLSLSFQRMLLFWFPDWRSAPFSQGVWLVTGLSAMPLISALRNGLSTRMVLAAALIVFSVPYWFVSAELRYRTPVIWVSLLLAAPTITTVYEQFLELISRVAGRRRCY